MSLRPACSKRASSRTDSKAVEKPCIKKTKIKVISKSINKINSGNQEKVLGTHGVPEVTMEYPWRPEEGIGYSGLVIEKVDDWELNLDPLEKVLIATEPYLQLLNPDF